MITCTRRLQFCAGHRVMGHETKCAHLHGHNYVLRVTATMGGCGRTTDNIGRVIDFSVLKEKLGGWIDKWWDHGFILYDRDALAIKLMDGFAPHAGDQLGTQKLYLMAENPTAENMAEFLLTKICPELFRGLGIEVVHISIDETENCTADAYK